MARGTGRHDLERVPEPAGGYPITPTSVHSRELGIVAIADVHDGRRRQRATARFDLLDRERQAGRLEEAAFLAGRECERVFEGMNHIGGGGQWMEGDRVDAATAAELAAVLGADRARLVNAFLGFLVRNLGRGDTRLLWMVLGERAGFSVAAATLWDRTSTRGYRYAADRFADALEALAAAKAAKGRAVR